MLGEEDEKQSSGKIFKKLSLGEYKWISYQQADKIVSAFGSGLVKLGMEPKQTISIYAETRKVLGILNYTYVIFVLPCLCPCL